jgi:Ca2+-binding EF-hand superfamily protein
MKVDMDDSGFISVDDIREVLMNLGLKLSFKQLSALLYYQDIAKDSKWRKNYNELIKLIEEEGINVEQSPKIKAELSALELQRYEELKSHSLGQTKRSGKWGEEESVQMRKTIESPRFKKSFTTAKEIELDADKINYLNEQLNTLRIYLQDKGVNVRGEFVRFEKDGYIDFDIFCRVLASHDVDIDDQDVLNHLYSYLKEEEEGKISSQRLYDALSKGKILTQYKSKVIVKKTALTQDEVIAAGLTLKRLAAFVEENKIPLIKFKANGIEGKAMKKEHLDKTLKEIGFVITRTDFEALFRLLTIRKDEFASIPHLITILNEHISKKNPKKLNLEVNAKENNKALNKEIDDRDINLNTLLNINGDSYIDKNDFITTLTQAEVKIPSDKLAMVFNNLDVYNLTVLSIEYLIANIIGSQYKLEGQVRNLPIDDQIAIEVERLFKGLDELHNGILSEDELFKAVSASSHNNCTHEEVKEVMRKIDINQKGFLTKEDFSKYMIIRIKSDIMKAEDDMRDIKKKLNDNDLEGNGWLSPDFIYEILFKDYPAIQLEDLEEIFEEIDPSKEGKIYINDFMEYISNQENYTEYNKNSKKYKVVLTLKHQRRLLPNEFMTYFEKIASSGLYLPSFILKLHSMDKNLPSESFKLARNFSGLGYLDIDPLMDTTNKPTNTLKEQTPTIAGYIILNNATGVPIPDPLLLKRECILDRAIKVAFYDNLNSMFLYGSVDVLATWTQAEEDIWNFNSVGSIGTNPIVYKWCDNTRSKQIDVVFEFVSTIRYLVVL